MLLMQKITMNFYYWILHFVSTFANFCIFTDCMICYNVIHQDTFKLTEIA